MIHANSVNYANSVIPVIPACRIVAINVVSYYGIRHHTPHLVGGAAASIATKIDHDEIVPYTRINTRPNGRSSIR